MKDLPDAEARKNVPDVATAYAVSKVLSHRAAGDFVAQHKVQFDLVRILPCYTQGANELYTSAEEMRNPETLGSNFGVMGVALGVVTGQPRIRLQVYLEDVAKAHVLALLPDVAKNGDNLLIAGNGGVSFPWQDVVDVINREYPDAVKKGLLTPKAEDQEIGIDYDVASSEAALGFKFAGAEEMTKSLVDQYLTLLSASN